MFGSKYGIVCMDRKNKENLEESTLKLNSISINMEEGLIIITSRCEVTGVTCVRKLHKLPVRVKQSVTITEFGRIPITLELCYHGSFAVLKIITYDGEVSDPHILNDTGDEVTMYVHTSYFVANTRTSIDFLKDHFEMNNLILVSRCLYDTPIDTGTFMTMPVKDVILLHNISKPLINILQPIKPGCDISDIIIKALVFDHDFTSIVKSLGEFSYELDAIEELRNKTHMKNKIRRIYIEGSLHI